MKSNKFIVTINKPVHEVFAFTLNPANTPSWISSIVQEEVNEKPTKIGTIYRNQNKKGRWSEYTITAYEENKFFIFTSSDKNYNVKYSFRPIGDNATEVEYYEWVDEGELEEPFNIEILEKLKSIIESSPTRF